MMRGGIFLFGAAIRLDAVPVAPARIAYAARMSLTEQHRRTRRTREHSNTRASILDAARRVAVREGARNLSLRAAAAEAGFAPAALYGYFRNKDELLLALAADDLAGLARAMREAAQAGGNGRLSAAASVALDLLENTETFAAASAALPKNAGSGDVERLFNGRLISALTALSEAVGEGSSSRVAQADVVLIAATLTGLALLSRSGRLDALGFGNDELLARLESHFARPS
jgi:AcrR family transcriptional regulator